MDFYSFVAGPMLWFAFLVLAVSLLIRTAFFLSVIFRSAPGKNFTLGYMATSVARALLPFHRAALRKPLYVTVRYIFHISLIAVPVWLSGHINLWEESRFDWAWQEMPDTWADGLTLLVIGIAALFFVRRLLVPEIRRNSSISNYVLILIVALPFLTGYFLTHDTIVDSISFLGSYMETLHILSSELLLIGVAFLFYKTRLNAETCTGCQACEITCPTQTLLSKDVGQFRNFSYLHYQCICCGACVAVCPEKAASVGHEINPVRFLQIFSRQEIRSVVLKVCQSCGSRFAPEPQLEKIRQVIAADFTHVCPRCRMNSCAKIVRPPAGPAGLRRARRIAPAPNRSGHLTVPV